MKLVVLDASLALGLVLPDESSVIAEDLVRRRIAGEIALAAPSLWRIEILSGLMTASRRGRIDPGDRLPMFRALLKVGVRLVSQWPRPEELVSLADTDRLRVYDASYLWLAMRLDASLATGDRALSEAASRRGILWRP